MANKKERRMTKWRFLSRNFSTAWKIRQISSVAAQYTSEADLSELLWLYHASRFTHVLPIPYVQTAILNLLNPYNYTKLLPHSVIKMASWTEFLSCCHSQWSSNQCLGNKRHIFMQNANCGDFLYFCRLSLTCYGFFKKINDKMDNFVAE